MSLRAKALNLWLRRVEKPIMARSTSPQQLRRRLALNAKLFFHAPRGTTSKWHVLEHGGSRIDVLDVAPQNRSNEAVVLYIHGGGFVFGSPDTHAAMAAELGKRLGARVVLPRYRLAPEAVFPAAFEDVVTAWKALCASGVDPGRIVIGGDSAGGALTLSLLGYLVAEQAALPAAAFCFSPLTDMRFSGESFQQNAAVEAVLAATRADDMVQMYLDGHAPGDPRVSPLMADFAGASPVWITAGSTEILRDDSRRIVARLGEAGVDVTYVEEDDLPHVWPIFHNMLPEARQTLDKLTLWIRQQLERQGES